MSVSEVSAVKARAALPPARVLLAFGAIYFLWGTTFLAVRIAVMEAPPLLCAAARFLVAGGLLYTIMRLRGEPNPTRLEWRNMAVLALFMFVATYAAIFWAQQYVTSGITAIIEATVPITVVILEVFVFRRQVAHWRLLFGVLLGFAGIALLMTHNTDQHVAVVPALVILGAGVAWSFGTVLSRELRLPRSGGMISGSEMLVGGAVLLALSACRGELHPLPHIPLRAVLAVLYLIVFGSLIAYTAYVWLLGQISATRVSSHAYVNPVVAVAVGYFFAGEVITLRTVVASMLVLTAVFMILTSETRADDQRSRAE
jgi:drug/metabolite transporter (DMT)-like permease